MTHQVRFRATPVQIRVFWHHRSAGASTEDAAHTAGISRTTARQIIDQAGGIAPRTHPTATGRFLSYNEREQIALLWAAGRTRAQIAHQLGRHRATIGRELTRNSTRAHHADVARQAGIGYRASTAERLAWARARRPKSRRLDTDVILRALVGQRLRWRWSPRQIATTLARTYPDRPELRVSHETIYQALYVQGRGQLRRELAACLRTGRAVRRPQRRAQERHPQFKNMLMISERPAEVADRAVPGHWEGDLIMGAARGSAIGTLVERSTRFVMLLFLGRGHSPLQVAAAMIAEMGRLPGHLRRSVTWDQGVEMGAHGRISVALDMPIYFCDPHSPWERGSNENTNGLLRQYFPKGTDLSVHSAEYLDFVAMELNQRPRQTLGWDTPLQRMNELLLR